MAWPVLYQMRDFTAFRLVAVYPHRNLSYRPSGLAGVAAVAAQPCYFLPNRSSSSASARLAYRAALSTSASTVLWGL